MAKCFACGAETTESSPYSGLPVCADCAQEEKGHWEDQAVIDAERQMAEEAAQQRDMDREMAKGEEVKQRIARAEEKEGEELEEYRKSTQHLRFRRGLR